MPMISSVALPKVAFSNPPKDGPSTTAISSVAVPIQAARGMMAMADVINMAVDPQSRKCAAMDIGMNTKSSDSKLFVFSIDFFEVTGQRFFLYKNWAFLQKF